MISERPLAGIRVVDCVVGPLAAITRILVELGATVDRIVLPAGPDAEDVIEQRAANAGKRLHVLTAGAAPAADLLGAADVIVENTGLDCAALRAQRPALVTMTVSDFGSGNSFSLWQASDAVLHALSGELCRSGIRGKPPLLPPHGLGYACAVSQASYAVLVSLYHALRTGVGDHLDFAALEGAVQALDPGFGIGGSATLGRHAKLLSRDRPQRGFQYPILPCADGHVRICLLSARQWQGMFKWMGEPAAFADPAFNKTVMRYKSPELIPAIAKFFADKNRVELEAEGQRYGVPIAALASLGEAIHAKHFEQRAAFRTAALEGQEVILPNGTLIIDGDRMSAEPEPKETAPVWQPVLAHLQSERAFTGLRVIDLGVIVVGAETGRLFGDQGADVVKVESRDFPDGNRQSYLPYDLSVSFAAGHRNKRSLGLNLRDPKGKEIFLALAARADVILSNFKPGTMEKLGLDHASLAEVNPGIITVESSAFGSTGPWSQRMGYGPLVRAATGLTERWCYADDTDGYSDSITIYPDHTAGRVGAIAAIALLIRRLRTGAGGHVEVAQAEVMLNQFAADVARASIGTDRCGPPDAPWGVYRAAGEDAWCVVTVRNDADWHAMAPILGLQEDAIFATRVRRLAAADQLEAHVAGWMKERNPYDAMALLQQAGIPAAVMLRVGELPDFAFYKERAFFRIEQHPYLDEEVINERSHAKSAALAAPGLLPAPLAGEHSEEVLLDWLGLESEQISNLIAADVLQQANAATYALIAEARAKAAN